ncbi:MAG: EF-hand domain-containing protein [Planctomycetota bacterium]
MNTRTFFAAIFTVCFVGLASAQPPFGGRGGDRGGRGGFDPSSFLDRLDKNKNGVLDPDEQQGGMSRFVDRLAEFDSSIKPGQPIPLGKIKAGFAKMREQFGSGRGGDRGRGRGGDEDRRDDDDRRRDDDGDRRRDDDDAMQAELLVPGFGEAKMPALLLGFGPAAEMMSTTYSDRDYKDASDILRRYDRNKNGYLDADEISSRFSGNPLDFDVNRDNRLSQVELAIRSARRREVRSQDTSKSEKPATKSDKRGESPELFNGRRSYRALDGRSAPEGVPGIVSDKDANGDGQVTMAEFSSEWTNDLFEQFAEYDFNRDGVITFAEAVRNVEEGPASEVLAGDASGASSSQPAAAAPSGPMPKADPKYVKFAKRIISRNDKNSDGVLTASEWQDMLMSPKAADYNRDGKISADEYAVFLKSKDLKK